MGLEDTRGGKLEISVGKKVLLLLCSEEKPQEGMEMGDVGTAGLVLRPSGTA